jgi:hypothetical protein
VSELLDAEPMLEGEDGTPRTADLVKSVEVSLELPLEC